MPAERAACSAGEAAREDSVAERSRGRDDGGDPDAVKHEHRQRDVASEGWDFCDGLPRWPQQRFGLSQAKPVHAAIDGVLIGAR